MTLRPLLAAGLLLAATAAPSGCDLEPDVGPPIHAVCANVDSDPTTDVSFETDILRGIFMRAQTGCAECHDPASPTPVGVEIGGLTLTSFATLTTGGNNSAATIVVPGDPCSSVLLQKVKPGPPFGGRMPRNAPPFLSTDELNLINDWIVEGARDN